MFRTSFPPLPVSILTSCLCARLLSSTQSRWNASEARKLIVAFWTKPCSAFAIAGAKTLARAGRTSCARAATSTWANSVLVTLAAIAAWMCGIGGERLDRPHVAVGLRHLVVDPDRRAGDRRQHAGDHDQRHHELAVPVALGLRCHARPANRGLAAATSPRRDESRAQAAGAGISTRMRVPPPGGLTSSIVPPLASARSRRPSRPEPGRSAAPPTPSSAISSLRAPRPARGPHLDQRGARVLLRVRDRLGDDVVGDRLGARRRAARRELDQLDRDARAQGEALDRLGQAEVDQHRGMDPVGELAQLVDRELELALRLLEQRRRALRLALRDDRRRRAGAARARSGAAARRRGGRARAGAGRCRRPRSAASGRRRAARRSARAP